MIFFQSIFLDSIILIFIYLIFKKNSILIDNVSFSIHKKIGARNSSPIVLGGFYLLITTLLHFKSLSYEVQILLVLICIIGVMSDRNIISNTIFRFILQILLISFLVYFGNLSIKDLRVDFINHLLENRTFNLIFTVFCIAVLMNGNNFIDGLNGLITGYYLFVILSILFVTSYNSHITINDDDLLFIKIFFFTLVIFYIPNIFGKIYMGDGGSYIIASIIGFYLIKFYQLNNLISPFYITLLLWYPAFENLFSLVRRIRTNNNISEPDNKHLHHLIYRFVKLKKYFNHKFINYLSSIVILIFNLPSFILSSIYYSDTFKLMFLLIFNISFYCLVYFRISKEFRLKNNENL